MLVVSEIEPCRRAVREAQSKGRIVGLVPTMGALHEGHMSLVHAASERCSSVAVTIFANPTQFGPNEDYDRYPKTPEKDLAVCESAGVDIVFAPSVETMYPGDDLTTVRVSRITETLCGPHRPGHFDGVTTVCAKLFNTLPADVAFFGEKDYQQLIVIRRMVQDLNIPLQVVGCPTVREPDGLALSSRNRLLSAEERKQAASLSRALFATADRIGEGEQDAAAVTDGIRGEILAAGPAKIDYVDVVDPITLKPVAVVNRPVRICLAVRIGSCRLIDNIGVDAPKKVG
jgi:pantoate--beta-alanine ligase